MHDSVLLTPLRYVVTYGDLASKLSGGISIHECADMCDSERGEKGPDVIKDTAGSLLKISSFLFSNRAP